MSRGMNRRRFLAISACAATAPGSLAAATYAWRGAALGATASITLGGIGRASAAKTFEQIETELSRLEDIFSLYRTGSSISRLNRDGRLDAPPLDLLDVLRDCSALNAATEGAFDPTVQVLWLALSKTEGVRSDVFAAARMLVGMDGIEVSSSHVAFADPRMAITLNGIAQGYITDRIAGLLRSRGFENVLIDMGEIAGLGDNYGKAWSAEVALPGGRIAQRLTLRDRCLAVSAPRGTLHRGHAHILSPFSDAGIDPHQLVAVSADRAAIADGLSTGCCLLSKADARRAVAQFAGARLETFL